MCSAFAHFLQRRQVAFLNFLSVLVYSKCLCTVASGREPGIFEGVELVKYSIWIRESLLGVLAFHQTYGHMILPLNYLQNSAMSDDSIEKLILQAYGNVT